MCLFGEVPNCQTARGSLIGRPKFVTFIDEILGIFQLLPGSLTASFSPENRPSQNQKERIVFQPSFSS